MSTRVVGYEGEGRARRPIVVDEGPGAGRTHGYVAHASRRGYAVIGGELVVGTRTERADRMAEYAKTYRARQRAASA